MEESWQVMETAIYESVKSTCGVLKTTQKTGCVRMPTTSFYRMG